MRRHLATCLILPLTALGGILGTGMTPVHAATLTVSNINDAGPGSLRATIAAAAAGDTITFAPGLTGTITLTSGALVIGKSLTITGPGQATLAVDGSAASRVVEVDSGIVTISGLTLQNGRATACPSVPAPFACAGGLYNAGTLTLSGDTITGSSTSVASSQQTIAAGGGIYNAGTLTLNNTGITNDAASVLPGNVAAEGGGLYNAGTATINYSSVTNDKSYPTYGTSKGGGIYNAGTLTLYKSFVNSNFTGASGTHNQGGTGGGIYNAGNLKVGGSTVNGNTVNGFTLAQGGGISNATGAVAHINNSSVNNNTVSSAYNQTAGGGIWNASGSSVTVNGSNVKGNSVTASIGTAVGGGVYNAGSASISYSTVSGNAATSPSSTADGGGLYEDTGGAVTLTGNTITSNTPNNCSPAGLC